MIVGHSHRPPRLAGGRRLADEWPPHWTAALLVGTGVCASSDTGEASVEESETYLRRVCRVPCRWEVSTTDGEVIRLQHSPICPSFLSMITFTPLSGSARSQNTSPLAYLLQVDDVRILRSEERRGGKECVP